MIGYGTTKDVLIVLMAALVLTTGCSLAWAPSDKELVQQVKNYYLFNYSGEVVEASVLERGELLKDCNCYPIKMEICRPEKKACRKTFYLFRNRAGEAEVSEYMPRPIV